MRSRTRRILLVIAVLFVLASAGAAFVTYLLFSAESPFNRDSAIQTTLEWGRLAPFPGSAEKFTISATGNMFTRGFRVSFMGRMPIFRSGLSNLPGPPMRRSVFQNRACVGSTFNLEVAHSTRRSLSTRRSTRFQSMCIGVEHGVFKLNYRRQSGVRLGR